LPTGKALLFREGSQRHLAAVPPVKIPHSIKPAAEPLGIIFQLYGKAQLFRSANENLMAAAICGRDKRMTKYLADLKFNSKNAIY
jgi:hypothetical protein